METGLIFDWAIDLAEPALCEKGRSQRMAAFGG